jgi:hypothetical protein
MGNTARRYGDLLLPFFQADRAELSICGLPPLPRHARVIHEDIDSPEPQAHGLDQFLHLRFIRQVRLVSDDPWSFGLELLGPRVDPLTRGGNRNVRASCQQMPGNGEANARWAPRACHNGGSTS